MAISSFSGAAWGASGKVLQVVQSIHGTIASSSSSTYADTGLTATITPSSASSKVLVLVTHASVAKNNNTACAAKLLRGSTDLGVFDGTAGYTGGSGEFHVGAVAFNYLDSPATTSATTYKTQFASTANNPTVYINNSGKSSITLLEIGA